MQNLSTKVFKQELTMITPDYFKFLDFWFYIVGINICPADTRNKRISDNWKVRQSEPMSPNEYEAMKKEGAYIRGAAVITGKVWRGDYVGYHLNGVDLDNQKAIEEICYSYKADKPVTPEELAEQTLVEWHSDDKTKLHLYVYSKHPFKNKTSDAGRVWFNKQTMPNIEVKGTKSLMFCAPSMHRGGHRYNFLKQRPPGVSENLEQTINDILLKYDIEYLSGSDKKVRDGQRQRDANKIINKGSRHNELLREMNARLHEFIRRKPLEEIKQMCIAYNNLSCTPPLENKELEQMWNDSVIHVVEKEGEEQHNTTVELISVAEAKRRPSGKVAVKGMIVGISSVEHIVMATKFSCSNCGISEGPIEHTPPLFSVPYQLSLNYKSSKCISCGERTY